MSLTITNNDNRPIVFEPCEYADELLTFGAAGSVAAGTLLARATATGKMIPFVKNGEAAQKTCSAETYALVDGDAFVMDVDNVGDATTTFNAASGSVTDTTTYPVADQDGLTEKVTVDGGTEQTVTFSGAHTTAAAIAASMNAQLEGCSVAVVGGQVVITSDTEGTGSTIAIGTGTCALTWAAAVDGTGDAVNADAVTAAEIKTLIEGDTTATVSVSNGIPTITSPTTGSGSELDFKSGTMLAKLGLSVEVVTPTAGAETPLAVLTETITATGAGDKPCRPMEGGKANFDKLIIVADGDNSNIDGAVKDGLRNYGIFVEVTTDNSILDNQ